MSLMTIPERLKIGGHEVRVVLEDLSTEDISGDWDNMRNLIRLDSTQTASQQEASLIHEILHAMNTQFDDSETGHILLESLAQQIYQVLSDNQMLR